jgi:hypothetical protein
MMKWVPSGALHTQETVPWACTQDKPRRGAGLRAAARGRASVLAAAARARQIKVTVWAASASARSPMQGAYEGREREGATHDTMAKARREVPAPRWQRRGVSVRRAEAPALPAGARQAGEAGGGQPRASPGEASGGDRAGLALAEAPALSRPAKGAALSGPPARVCDSNVQERYRKPALLQSGTAAAALALPYSAVPILSLKTTSRRTISKSKASRIDFFFR